MKDYDELICDCNNLHRSDIVEFVQKHWTNKIIGADGSTYGIKTCLKCRDKVREYVKDTLAESQLFMHFY
ncbi:MAG: hypothetical protein ACYC2P_05985 [Paludibacteraceae bacterium]